MPLLPNSLTSTISQAKQSLTNTLTNNQVVNGLQQGINNLKNAAGNLASNFNSIPNNLISDIPGVDMANIAIDVAKGHQRITDISNQGKKETVKGPDKFPMLNPLYDYASYNYIWTLSVLRPYDYNFPDLTYKRGNYNTIIFRSGSGYPDRRVELSNYAFPKSNPTGKFDFFIDNVRITGVVGQDKLTGNTNSTGLNFSIFEPYSVGLFFQSLAVGAKKEGYKNWVGMPLLLTLEFTGHKSYDEQNVPGELVTRKHYPIRITTLEMAVTQEGSRYECTAVPWNEQAYSKEIGRVKSDINIKGATVQDMLQKGEESLQTIVNKQLTEMSKKQDPNQVPDQIVILFPVNIDSERGNNVKEDNSNPEKATTSPNEVTKTADIEKKLGVERSSDGYNLVQSQNINSVGLAPLGYSQAKKDRESFSKEDDVWDEKAQVYKRGNVIISSNKGEASFKQNTDIVTIINQVILGSDYGRQALDTNNIDAEGYVSWWRIDTQIYIIQNDDNFETTGRYPTIRVFRIIPYRVHHSRFIEPDKLPKGVKKLQQKALKEYNYIYTGKNLDILDFKIQFNTAFYSALVADSGKSNQDLKRVSKQADVSTDKKEQVRVAQTPNNSNSDQSNEANSNSPNYTAETDISANKGGTGPDDPSTLAARQFQQALLRSGDMIDLEMKILGDPFYLGDSGMGNYTAKDTDHEQINSDGAINYQKGDVYITVNFRNPVDIEPSTGMYGFGDKIVPEFSGLYRVTQVQSQFDKGLFTQQLTMSRMLNLDLDQTGTAKEGDGSTLSSEQSKGYEPGKTFYSDVL